MVSLNKVITTFLVCFALALHSAAAQGPTIRTQVEPQSGSTSDTYIFSVIVEGAGEGGVPYLSGGSDFNLRLIGPESKISIINGKVESYVAYRYELTPKRAGMLETPAVELTIGGQKYGAPALKVKVTQGEGASADSGNDDYFLKQSLSKTSIYRGEQVTNFIELYSIVQLRDVRLSPPEYQNFWVEAFSKEERFRRQANNRDYIVYRLKRALFPLKAGKVTLPGQVISGSAPQRVKRRGFDPFNDDMFGGLFTNLMLEPFSLRSNLLEFEIKELPEGAPQDFDLQNPIVGDTEVQVSFDPVPINVGESKTLEVQVSSFGNLNPLKKLPLLASPLIKVYEEAPKADNHERADQIQSVRVFRYALVALDPGEVSFGKISLPYFDPESRSYKRAESSALEFRIKGTAKKDEPAALSSPAGSQAPSPTLDPMRYDEPTLIEKISEQVSLSFSLLVLALVVLAVFGVMALRRHSTHAAAPAFNAGRISAAENVGELKLAVNDLLAAKFSLTSTEYGGEALRALIKSRFATENLRYEALTLLDDLDAALYSGKAPGQEELLALKGRAAKLAE